MAARDLFRFALRGLRRTPAATTALIVAMALGVAVATVTLSWAQMWVDSEGMSLGLDGEAGVMRLPPAWPGFQHTELAAVGQVDSLLTYLRNLGLLVAPDIIYGQQEAKMVASPTREIPVYPPFVGTDGDLSLIMGLIDRTGLLQAGSFIVRSDAKLSEPAVVIGYALAQVLFGSASSSIGEEVLIDGHPYTVRGVLRRGTVISMRDEANSDFVVVFPYSTLFQHVTKAPFRRLEIAGLVYRRTAAMSEARLESYVTQWFEDVGLLRSRFLSGVAAEPGGLVIRQRALNAPDPWRVSVFSFSLFVAIVNLATVSYVRVQRRRMEIALSQVAGASPAVVAAQVVAENLLVGLAAAFLSFFLVMVIRAGVVLGYPEFVHELGFRLSPVTALLALVISVVSATIASLVPVAQAMRLKPAALMDTEE